MADQSPHCSNSRLVEKLSRNAREKSSSSSTAKTRSALPREMNKENLTTKETENLNGMVSRLKMRYENNVLGQRNTMKPRTDVKNSRIPAATKSRVDGINENPFGAKKRVEKVSETRSIVKKRVESTNDRKIVGKHGLPSNAKDDNDETKKRAKIQFRITENVEFATSRFEIWNDERTTKNCESTNEKLAAQSNANSLLDRRVVRDRRLMQIVPESSATSHERFTPSEAVGVPLTLKKVKVEHRKSLTANTEKPNNFTCSVSHFPSFQLTYDDNLIAFELEKEKPLSRRSRGFREKNITDGQRKIIVKFLMRLNVHTFYPSFLMHQIVKLFDAVVDAKLISVEELQLVALTSMWIVLKKEQIAYRVPTAKKILSYSEDLYEGKVDLLIRCEREILQCVNFEITFPDVITMLCYYITTSGCSQFFRENDVTLTYYCGSYMIDLTLFDEKLMRISAGLVAAAAAEAALFFVTDGEKCQSKPSWSSLRAPDASTRYSDEEIDDVRSSLIRRVKESSRRHTDGEIVFKKYSRSRYGRISVYLCSKVALFLGED